MSDRDWMNPPEEDLLHTWDIKLTEINLPTHKQRMKESLLLLGDLANYMEPGQFMVVQRHNSDETKDQRLFTAMIYKKTEDKLHE